MEFSRELRDEVISGEITVSFRLWRRSKVRVGGRYPVGPGYIEVDAVELLPFSSLPPPHPPSRPPPRRREGHGVPAPAGRPRRPDHRRDPALPGGVPRRSDAVAGRWRSPCSPGHRPRAASNAVATAVSS